MILARHWSSDIGRLLLGFISTICLPRSVKVPFSIKYFSASQAAPLKIGRRAGDADTTAAGRFLCAQRRGSAGGRPLGNTGQRRLFAMLPHAARKPLLPRHAYPPMRRFSTLSEESRRSHRYCFRHHELIRRGAEIMPTHLGKNCHL